MTAAQADPNFGLGDRDVALVIARYTGASLGLLAFTITSLAGLITGNSVTVTLSRSLFALFAFCALGFLLGSAAQLVVSEYERERASDARNASTTVSAASAINPGSTSGSPGTGTANDRAPAPDQPSLATARTSSPTG